jgi:hypothetical protein
VFRPLTSSIYTPIAGAPWYFCAAGHVTADSLKQIESVISAVLPDAQSIPVLDLTLVEVDREAGERLAAMVARGDVNLLGGALVLPPPLTAVVLESHLEAVEAVLTFVRQRRNEGMEDTPALSALLERIRPVERQ